MKKPYLNKTDIVGYLRCSKKLWLSVNKHKVGIDEPDSGAIVNGHLAVDAARAEYPDGVLVKWETWSGAIAQTKHLMADESVKIIYDATFFAEGTLVRIGILERYMDGWNIIEVKSTTKLTAVHYNDIAIQIYVVKNAGVNLINRSILHITKDFVYNGNYQNLFTKECVFSKANALQDNIMHAISMAQENIKLEDEPHAEMGPMCKQGIVCEYKKYCEQLAPADHISYLPRGGTVQKKIAIGGFTRITEIPAGLLKSANHVKVHRITMSGKESYTNGAKAKIDAAPFPHHYLDFESIQFSVPKWKGVKSWRQIPFQFSNHIQFEDGSEEYESFLDISGSDPRRYFAEALINQWMKHGKGTVFVYNQAFEQMVLRHLGEDFPDLKPALLSISDRCFDLLPIMKEHYYNPNMKGSWSIKKVLDCFVPEMTYDSLEEVKNGLQAQGAYLNLVDPDWNGDKDKLYHNALEYCKYDTLSMVKLVENIIKRES